MCLQLPVDGGGVVAKRGFVFRVLAKVGIFLHVNVVPDLFESFVLLLQGLDLLVQIY
jgi:hypothetical protein